MKRPRRSRLGIWLIDGRYGQARDRFQLSWKRGDLDFPSPGGHSAFHLLTYINVRRHSSVGCRLHVAIDLNGAFRPRS
jgi:hypothetical protein